MDCSSGYMYCKYCNKCVSALGGCDHMTPKPVKLDRYAAGALYNMAKSLGIEGDYSEAIHELADAINKGDISLAIAIRTNQEGMEQ